MRWIFRYASKVVVRRLVMSLIALAVCAISAGIARAEDFPDQGMAFSACISDRAGALAAGATALSGEQCDRSGNYYLCTVWAPGYPPPNGFTRSCGQYSGTLRGSSYGWPAAKTCSSRNVDSPPGDKSAGSPMPWPNCVAGCKLQQEHVSFSMPGGVMVYGRRNATYVNETCTAQPTSQNGTIDTRDEQPKPTEPECSALGGGQTACFKSNGDHCATASTGKTFCWTPNETGKKIDGEDAQVKGKKGEPVTPPDIKIEDKDWQRTQGHQQTACINNTCTTYNVTNYQTAPGGTAKNSTGDNNADGSGNTSGNGKPGKGDGGKDGEEDGDSATESGNCDTPPICTGDTLKCLQLKFTWKIECNTKGNEITNGTGCGENDIPVCAGKSCKAEAYSQLLQQWKQRCSFEGDRDAAKRDAQSGAADGAGDDLAGVVGGLWAGDGVTPSLDQNRLSIGGGNVIPDVEIMGTKFVMPQGFYDALAIIKKIIIAAAMIAAFAILWRR